MTDHGLTGVPDEHAAPALGSELVASIDSGETLEVSQLYAGIRRTLWVQAQRLEFLAKNRLDEFEN